MRTDSATPIHTAAATGPAAPPDAEADRLVQRWLQARQEVNRLERALDRSLRSEVGVTLVEFGLLCAAAADDCAPNQQTIADALGLTKSSVSRYVDRAVREGRLEARVSDASRREKELTLTDAGRSIVDRGYAVLAALAAAERFGFDS